MNKFKKITFILNLKGKVRRKCVTEYSNSDKIKIKNNIEPSEGELARIDIKIDNDKTILSELFVPEEYRRKGYASKIRSKAIKYLLKKGITEIETLCCPFEENISLSELSKFYKKNFLDNGAYEVKLNLGNEINHIQAYFYK